MADSNDSIWSIKADTGNAIKALGSMLASLSPLQKITQAIAKQGGVGGVVSGGTAQMTNTQKVLGQLNDELTEQESLLADVKAQLKDVASAQGFRQLTEEAQKYTQQISDLKDEMQQASGKTPGDPFRSGALRPFSTAAQTLNLTTQSQAATQVAYGIQSATDVTRTFGELKNEVSESLPRLKDLAAGFKNVTGTISGLATGATTLGEVFAGVELAITPVVAIAAVLVAGMLVLGKVLDLVSAGADKAGETEDAYIQQLNDELQIKQQLEQLSTSTDPHALEQANKDAQQKYQDQLDLVRQLQANVDAINKSYSDLGSSLNPQARANLGKQGQEAQDALTAAQKSLITLGQAAAQLMAGAPATQQIINANIALQNLKTAEDQLTQVRTQARDAAKQQAKAVQQFGEQANYDAMKTRRDRDRQDAQAEMQHNKDMAKTTEDGLKQLVSLAKDYNKTITADYKSYYKEEANAVKALDKSLAQNDKDYQKSVTKTTAQFQKDELKSQAAFAKEELRRQQDLNNNLSDIELQNDAVAYIQAQRQAAIDNQRATEDHQASEDDAKDAEQQQLDDLKQSRDDQRQSMLDSFADEDQTRQENLNDQLADEKANYAERRADQVTSNAQALQDQAASYADQQAQTILQRQWQDDDTKEANARQLQQMQDAYTDQQTALGKQESDLLGVIKSGGQDQIAEVTYQQLQLVSAYEDGTANIVAAVQTQLATLSYNVNLNSDNLDAGGVPNYNTNGGTLGGRYGIGAGGGVSLSNLGALSGYGNGSSGNGLFAAKGGVFTQPTPLLAGDDGPEAVIPLKPSGGLPASLLKALGGGGSTNFDFSGLHIGDGVSNDVFKQQMQIFGQTMIKAIRDARAGLPA